MDRAGLGNQSGKDAKSEAHSAGQQEKFERVSC